MWFNDMDKDSSGTINTQELTMFLRQNKEIEKLMSISKDIIKDGAVSSDGADPSKRNMHLKTLMKVVNDLDLDGSGTQDWDEFVEFFRRAGLLHETPETAIASGRLDAGQLPEIADAGSPMPLRPTKKGPTAK